MRSLDLRPFNSLGVESAAGAAATEVAGEAVSIA